MTPKRKNDLSTELKDLDVDRVDGVDRPATGRAFALFKSEGDDMAQIIAVLRRISKSSHDDVVNHIIAAACDRHIVKMLDSADRLVGYVVKGEDVSSPLYKTLAEAVAFVERVVRGEIAKGRAQEPGKRGQPGEFKPEDQRMQANGSTPVMTGAGATAALDDPNNSADPKFSEQFQRRSSDALDGPLDHLGNRRMRAGKMDGKRIYNRTIQERAAKRARII